MRKHVTPPELIRKSGWFRWLMDKVGTRVEDKIRVGYSPTDVGFRRGWNVGNNYRVWFDADYHR